MTTIRLSAAGLEIQGDTPLARLTTFLDTLARGVGQVMFQNNSYTGLLFLVGIGCSSLLFATAALVGVAISTLTAIALRADSTAVRNGMFGFNGALTGIAVLHFLQPTPLTWICVILAAAGSTIVAAALASAFTPWKLPGLTAPFVLTSLGLFLSTARFGRLQPSGLLPTAGLPTTATVEGVVSASTIVEGLFTGLAQVFFQGSVVTGVLFAAGLLVASRMAFAAALVGSFVGLLVAWGMGAAEPAIRTGAFGFNSALVAIALASVFLSPSRASIAYALFAAMMTPFVVATVTAAFEPIGMPALTLPFVLVTWMFLLASRMFPRIPLREAP